MYLLLAPLTPLVTANNTSTKQIWARCDPQRELPTVPDIIGEAQRSYTVFEIDGSLDFSRCIP